MPWAWREKVFAAEMGQGGKTGKGERGRGEVNPVVRAFSCHVVAPGPTLPKSVHKK